MSAGDRDPQRGLDRARDGACEQPRATGKRQPEGTLLVDVRQARDLVDPEYRIGDVATTLIMDRVMRGSARLGRVYAVVRLGRHAFETACEASADGSRAVQWAGQRVRFVYRGETQLFVQVRDRRSVGVREDPLIGEAAFPLRPLRANLKRGVIQRVELPIVRCGVVAGRVVMQLHLEQVKGLAWLRRCASDASIESPEMPALAALAEAYERSAPEDATEDVARQDEGDSPCRTASSVSVLDEFGQFNDDWDRIKGKRGLHALRIRIASVSNLADPEYRFGDLTKMLVHGRESLKRAVFAEAQVGGVTARTPSVPGKTREFGFPDMQDFKFAYRGDSEVVVRVSNDDGLGNRLLGAPLIGEAVLPLDTGLDDCEARSIEIPIFLDGAAGNVALEYRLEVLTASEYQKLADPEGATDRHEVEGLGSSVHCEEHSQPPWGEEYALIPLLGPCARKAVMALGASSAPKTGTSEPSDADYGADGILSRPRGALEALRAGLPDQWKAFAWFHCSGAAARVRDADSDHQMREIHERYAKEQCATFSAGDTPKAFATFWEGRAPLFDQGCLRVATRGTPEHATLEDAWPSLVGALSAHGLDAAKRILWTLSRSWSQRSPFSPWLPPLCLAMLQFCEERAAWAMITSILERAEGCRSRTSRRDSAPAARCFLFSSREGLSRASEQLLLMAHHAGGAPSRALQRLAEAGLDVHRAVSLLLQDCLASVLPTRAFLRLIAPILCEGWEAAGRLLLVLLGRLEQSLLGSLDLEALEERLAEPLRTGGEAVDSIFIEVFSRRLATDRFPFESLEGKAPLQPACLEHERALCWPCFPRAGERSQIASQAALVNLFSTRLPEMAKFWAPCVVFSTQQGHGYALSSLVAQCAKFAGMAGEDTPMLFLVKSVDGAVAGAYSPVLWQPTQGRWLDVIGVDPSEAFVFSIRGADLAPLPDSEKVRTWAPVAAYPWQGHGGSLFSLRPTGCLKGELLFGGDAEGNVALSLDDDLKRGCTGACAAFASPPLFSAPDFEVAHVEVLALVDETRLHELP